MVTITAISISRPGHRGRADRLPRVRGRPGFAAGRDAARRPEPGPGGPGPAGPGARGGGARAGPVGGLAGDGVAPRGGPAAGAGAGARRSQPAGPLARADHRRGPRGGDPVGDAADRGLADLPGGVRAGAGGRGLAAVRDGDGRQCHADGAVLADPDGHLERQDLLDPALPRRRTGGRSSRTATCRPISTWGWDSWWRRCWRAGRAGSRRGPTRASGRRMPRASWSSGSSPRCRATASSAWSPGCWWSWPSLRPRGGGSSAAWPRSAWWPCCCC